MSQVLPIPRAAIADHTGRSILVHLLEAVDAGAGAAHVDALMDEFGSLARILTAGVDAQRRVIGHQPKALRCLGLVRDAMLHALKTEIETAPVLSSGEAVLRYLHVAMAQQSREQVRALFLAQGHRLIRDEVLWTGCVTAAAVYPREVMRRALELGSVSLVLVHNHPSGNLEPSRDDIQITRALVEAGRHLQVAINDHIIISRTGHTSLRTMGYI